MRHCIAVLVFCAWSASFGVAPLVSQGSTHKLEPVCFRARPAPACGSFWLSEFGAAQRITHSYNDRYALLPFEGPLYTWEAGWLINLGTHQALGGTAFVSQAHEGTMSGVRPTYRQWLNDRTSLDIAPGIILGHRHDLTPGFSGQVAVTFSNWVSLTSTVQVVRMRSYRISYNTGFPAVRVETSNTVASWFLGARLGGVPGVVAGVGFAAFVALLFTALAD